MRRVTGWYKQVIPRICHPLNHGVSLESSMKEEIKQLLETRTRQTVTGDEFKESAVLMPVYKKHGKWYVLFTQRTDKLTHHAGQISFPGGRRHHEDRNLLETALRESYEEIGLREEDVEVLGILDDVITETTFYRITPFLGIIPHPYRFHPDEFEVQEIFSVSVNDLMNNANISSEERVYGERAVRVYAYKVEGRCIWGATALILNQFIEIIGTLSGARCNR